MAVNIADIIKQLQKAQSKANKANIARYEAGLKELGGGRETLRSLYSQAGDLSSVIGRQATQDISRGAQRGQAMGMQQLISSGLGNTTITGAMMRGVEEDRRRAMQGVEEQKAQQQMGLMTQQAGQEFGMSGTIADFIGARSDVGPDMGQYGNLIQQAAAAGDTSKPITTFGGLGPMARAGLDAFGQPLGSKFGGGGAGGGGAGGGGAGGGGGLSTGGTPGSFGPSGQAGAGGGGGMTGMDKAKMLQSAFGITGQPGGPITAAMRQQAEGAVTKSKSPGSYGSYQEYKKSTKRPVSAGYWSQVYKGGRGTR